MADARIRLRLDASDAKRELQDLRGEFARTTAEAGNMGGGFNLSLGRVAAIGAAGLGGFAVARGTLGGIRDIGQAATEGPSAMLEELALGMQGANARGSLQALSSVRQQAGLAVGFGADPESFRGLFKVQEMLEQKAEQGQLKLTQHYGKDILEGLARSAVDRLGQIWQSLQSAIGGS